jgi:hypothetical protein
MIQSVLKKLTARGLRLRLIAFACFVFGLIAVLIWQQFRDDPPATNSVGVLLKPAETNLWQRNLSEYESGGRFSDCNNILKTEVPNCEKDLNQGRNFLLHHWESRTKAYIVFHRHSTDWSNEYHVFIEPDENGTWRVTVIWEPPPQLQNHEDKSSIVREINAYTIERREITKTDGFFLKGSFYILLLDKNGKTVDMF